MASEEEIQSILEDYKSSLNDLVFNSKPLINVLTMLAEENEAHADGIVKVIRDRVKSVGIKLKMPSLYLLDSILKNVGGDFINILSNYMIDIFTDVFDEGDEKIRMSLYKLRNTWPQYFPSKFLYELDLSVKELDPNWPVTDPPSSMSSIHVNPKFLVQSEKKEKVASSDESIHIANLKAREKEEKLKAEERKIKEQLKKLQEEQLKLQQSRLEEERLKQEELLRKQQEDRERLIKEQQKQLLTLRMQQEKDLRMKNLSTAMTSLSPKKTVLPESKKNIDPRLAKREMMANAKEMIKSIPSSSEPMAVKLSPRKDVTPSHMQDLRKTLTQRHQDRSSKANLIASSKTQKESRLPLEGNNNTSKLTPSLPLDKLVSKSTTFIHTTVNRDHEELTNEPQTNPDLAVKSESSVEPKAVKRLVLNEDERLVVVVSEDQGNANGNKQLSDVQDSIGAPPVKKRKSDEPIKSVVLSMDVEEDDDQTAVTGSETSSDKATVEKPVEKGAENTSPTSSEIDPSNRFRKRNRSEWRKLMIEKAKLERRKRIPSEKELPRAMRVENHEELVNKLKARLSTGEIKEKEYASLVKQLDLMYEVQRTRETPEKKRELAENQREKGSDSVDIKDRLGQAKDIGSSPSKVDKTDTIQQTGKALSQKETNQDLIRQLREKRMNAEKEQREDEWRLKRDWNIDQLRAVRDRRDRDRDRRDRDGDSRVRRGFENRTDRRDRGYEPDVRDARDRRRNRGRDRDRLLNERADYSRSRFNRDRDNRERREQSPPRDRRHNRLDEPSYRRGGRNVESRSRLPVESNEKESQKGDKDDNIPADSSKGKQDDAEKEKGDAAPAPAVEVEEQKDKGEGSGDAVTEQEDIELGSEVKEQPNKEADEASSSLENDNISCEPAMKDSAPENTASAEAKGDVVTSEASAPTEEEERDSLKGDIETDSHEDHTKTVMNPKERKPFSKEKKGIESFRIPKKERPVDGRPIEERSVSQKPYPVDLSRDVDDRSTNQLPVDLPLDDDVRMLSWRHQEGDNHPMDGRRHRFHGDRDVMVTRRQQFGSRHDRRMFPEERRGTPPYIDHDLEPGPDGHRSFPANERSLSWRERHDPEFRPGLHPDFDRPPGFLDRPRPGEDPDFRPGFRDEDVDFPDRFPLRQGLEGDHRKMSPMHQPDAPMQLRPDIDDMYHQGPPISGPRYREPQHHGPRFREPRFEGPRMAGPGSDFGHFREPGYREMDEDRILRRDFRGPRFGQSDLLFEEMDRNLGPEERFLPPDSHRHLEGPIERRPEYFGDREPSSIDYRHGLREPWRGDHPDSFRHSPFDESRLDKEDRQRFEERRQYPMEVDRPMPYQPGPPGNSEHLDSQQRRYMHPDQGGEGFRPMPHEYEERRPSPVIFDYAHGPPDQFMRASEPYSMPPSAGFTMSNPLMKMIENVKRSAGEPTYVDQVQKPPQAPQSFIGVNELFHKLVSTGVIATQDAPGGAQKSATPPPRLETQEESIPEINFVMEDLKKRHLSIINTLYLGSQCSSCGLRYPEEEKQLYRDHLDWHFRVNRREKENKKSISRPWFYSVEQWCDMDDVFDIEEAAKSNVFENEAKREETSTVETGDGSCSVLQGQDDSYCNICFDPFEQFWDEALEEWRYKDAVRVKGKTYHRNCYDDMESGGYLSENDEEIQSEEEKFSPVAFSEFLKPERSEPIWKSEEESSVVSPVKFWTISVKTDPEDVRMDADDDSRNSVFKIDVNKVAVKTEPDQPVAVKSEPEDVEMFEEVNQRISMGNSENNFYKVSVKSEPLEPVSVKTEPVDSNIVDRESATASLPASEKGTEQSSLTKDPSDLMDPPVETEHQTTRSAADMAPVLSEQAGDALEKDITVSDGAPGEIKVASQSSSEEAIVKGKEDLLPGSHPVDEAKRTVTVTETTSAIAQDVVMDSAVSGNADERTASCALESSDTSAILNPERKTEDVSVCGTEKTEIGESSAEMVTNNVTSAQEDVEKDVEPKKLSEQFQAENIDEIIFEPLTENKEMKNLDEIIESEGKPQSS